VLVDSNVLVAAIVETHQHHAPSLAFLDRFADTARIAAHSWSEVYNTLTKRSAGAHSWPAAQAWLAMADFVHALRLIGLSPEQTLEGVRLYALGGGVGPRVYDFLIGRLAVIHGLGAIVTWNTSHMRGLFPALEVLTPAEALARA